MMVRLVHGLEVGSCQLSLSSAERGRGHPVVICSVTRSSSVNITGLFVVSFDVFVVSLFASGALASCFWSRGLS